MYKLTIEVCANELADLEQLLCEIAVQISCGVVTSATGSRAGSYKFNLEEIAQPETAKE